MEETGETPVMFLLTDPQSGYVGEICQWLMDWWGREEHFSEEKMHSYVCNSLCAGRIPQTHLLLLGGDAVGMYQLSMADLEVRPDIYPWLINVFVKEEYRGRGYLKLLVDSAIKEAEKLGLRELYLFTKYAGLYERYGWSLVETFRTFLTEDDVQRLYRLEISEKYC